MSSRLLKPIRSFGILRCIALSMVFYGAATATAQDTTAKPEPIYTYEFQTSLFTVDNLSGIDRSYDWTPDNTLLIHDMMKNPDSGELTAISVLFDPYAPRGTAPSLLSIPEANAQTQAHNHNLPARFTNLLATSPDGHFDFYSVLYDRKGDDGHYYSSSSLGIVNHDTGAFKTLPDIVPTASENLVWSANSEAAVFTFFGDYEGGTYYAYVSGFAEDVTQASIILLGPQGEIADRLKWDIMDFYTMDSTGRYLLADGYLQATDVHHADLRLILLDMQTLTYDIIATDTYAGLAAFEQPGQRHVLYINSKGVFAYDRQAQTSVLLTDTIDSSMMLEDYHRWLIPGFSPDGHYLATTLADKEYEQTLLKVYAIPPIPEDQ